MNLMRNKIVNGMDKGFQDHSGKPGSTAYENPGKYQKLVPAKPVIQPVKDELIAPGLFQPVFLKVSFKF